MTQTAAFLSKTEFINSQLVETSINGRFGLVMFIQDTNPDSLVWGVVELVGSNWELVYFASESQEDAADVFGIYDEAELESSFDLFDNAAAAIGQAA